MTRRIRTLAATAVLGLFCGSCALFDSPSEAFIDGVDQYAVQSGLLDEYVRYVDADPDLAERSKDIRKETAAGLRRLLDQAKGGDR